MIDTLPIADIESLPQIPVSKLATLKRAGVPVTEGILVVPEKWFSEIVTKCFQQTTDPKVFGTLVIEQLKRLSVPAALKPYTNKGRNIVINGEVWVSGEKLWQYCLSRWMQNLKLKVDGYAEKLEKRDLPLFALPPLFLSFPIEWGGIYRVTTDIKKSSIIINSNDTLSKKQENSVTDLVLTAAKNLTMSYEYVVFVGTTTSLVTIKDLSDPIETPKQAPILDQPKQSIKYTPLATKIFSLLGATYQIPTSTDGFYCAFEGSDTMSSFHKISEVALSFPTKPVLLCMPQLVVDHNTGELNEKQLEAISKFARMFSKVRFQGLHQKGAYNVELVLPSCTSPHLLRTFKQELLVQGISRKGTLKYWLPLTTVDNVVSFEEYFDIGIDGAICQLDILAEHIYSCPVSHIVINREKLLSLFEIVSMFLQTAHKNRCTVLVTGSILSHQIVLDFLIEQGIYYGILLPLEHTESMQDHIRWTEERVMKRKS
jgi:hypothetical protein